MVSLPQMRVCAFALKLLVSLIRDILFDAKALKVISIIGGDGGGAEIKPRDIYAIKLMFEAALA